MLKHTHIHILSLYIYHIPTSPPISLILSLHFPLYPSSAAPPPPPLSLHPNPILTVTASNHSQMAKLLLLLALCMLPALAAARFVRNPFSVVVTGRVYCDTCRAGFETSASKYIPGARVRVECKDRSTSELKYSIDGVTDSTGTYNIKVTEDRGNDVCDARLVSSSLADCAVEDPGRNRARVVLTRNNGIVSDTRYANALGFMRAQPLSGCSQLLQQYQENDD